MNVFSTGVANGTIVDKDGWVYVSKGGILNNTSINNGGEVDLLSSGSANATQIMTDGALNVGEKAVAIGTIVEGGSLVVEEKGIASDTTVNATGQMYVFSGGKTKGTTTVNDGGFLTLEWESIHSSVVVQGGKVTVLGGPAEGDMAFLQNFTVDSGGSLTVSGSALVSSGTITDGWAKITSNGTLEKVTLNAATVEVKNGALLSNADMKTGTLVNVESGGVIRKLAVSKGAVLTGVLRDVSELHFDGGTLDLNISGIAPGGEFLIGDTAYSAYISGSSYNCTLTVDSSAQPTGVYNLIEDATGFDKTITVKDTLGTTLGTLMLGGDPLVYGPLSYKLSIDTTGLLSVTVDAGNIITGDVTGETKEVPAGWTALGVNVNVDGILNVLNGGVASDTTINYHGEVNVSNGGVASNTTVNSGGALNLYEGGSASGVTINDGGGLNFCESNVTVEDVKVSAGGTLFTIAGTSVKDIDAEAGANLGLTVAKKTYAAGKYDGTPFEIYEVIDGFTPFGGLGINNDGIAINTVVNKDIYVYVSEGGLASNTTLYTDARMYVGSGGSAHIAYVSGGSLTIEDKGSAGLVNVGDLGKVYVSSGGVVSGLICYQYGTLTVSKGGVAGNVTVNKDGTAIVSGTVSGAYISDGSQLNIEGKITGQMTFETGAGVYTMTGPATLDFDLTKTAPGEPALVNGLSVAMADTSLGYTLTVAGTEAAGDYKLAEGATGFDKTITVVNTSGVELGTLIVAGGKTTIDGRDYTLTLNGTGSLGVTVAGGATPDITGDLNSTFNLTVGMVGSSVNILLGGVLDVLNGGFTSQTTVNSGGDLIVDGGGSADIVTVNFGGDLYVSNGATATLVKENGGYVYIDGGSTVTFVPNSFGGYSYNNAGDWATIHSGTTGTDLTAGNGGGIEVFPAGTAVNTTIATDGELWGYPGGKLTGKVTFETGANVKIYDGAIVDFDLTKTTAGDPALVNNLSFFGTAAVNYTLTVDGTEADGDYKLAEGAVGFDKTITVVNTSGVELGTLIVGDGTKTIDGRDYTLTLSTGGSLGLTIDGGGGGVDLTGDLSTTFALTAGMVGSSVNILDGGWLNVSNGAQAIQTTVKEAGGHLTVSSGGVASDTTVSGGQFILSGGIASKTIIKTGAEVKHERGVASDTEIFEGGELKLRSSDAIAKDITIHSGGTLMLQGTNSIITGRITFDDGAVVTHYFTPNTGIMNFDLTITAPGADALVNNLALVMAEKFSYTLTVDGTEAAGDYKLAEGATGFDKTITVKNTLGATLGTLTVAGGKTTIDGKDYTLTLTGTGSLGVTVAAGGGITPDITGDLSTSFDLTAGMVGSSVNILDGGELNVLNGGFTSQTTIQSNGDLIVDGGGSADVVTVNFGGDLYVSNGATATLVKENGGYVNSEWSMTVTFLPNSFGGYSYNNADDWATIHSGTTGTDLTAENGGGILVSSGGTAVDTTVAADGIFYVYSGGTATDTTVAADGIFYVSSGGTATGIVAEAGAYLILTAASGTYAQGTYAGSAFEIVENATDFTVHDKVALDVLSDGTAADTTVVAGGVFRVHSGGTAVDTTVAADGHLEVWAGGTATGIVAVDGARLGLTVAPGTYQKGTYAGSAFEVADTVTDFTVHSGGDLYVSAGGSADVVTVNFGGDLRVYNGATATLVKENGGYAGVQDGATVTFVPNSFGGYVYNGNDLATIHSGTTGTDLTAANKGRINVYSGGLADATTVNKEGYLYVYKGGTARDTTITDGSLFVSSGGVANKTTVNATGGLVIYSGGRLTGAMTFEDTAVVSAYVGGIVDFDISALSPDNAPLVNKLSLIKGSPSYTLTVDGSQLSGTYNLADGATGFDKTITVMSPLGEEYGTLTVGGSLSTAFADYTLNLSGAALTLDLVAKVVVDTTPPVVENVLADITAPTNGNVTVTADFTDNVAVAQKLFKFNDEPWQDYPTGGVVVTENATVSFMAIDTSSNNSDVVVITIGNIDKIAPTITAITPSTTEPAASVTVTANFADDVALAFQQFKIGDGAWQGYTTGVTVTENGTIYFKAIDAAGNETTDSYEVTNIQTLEPDTTKPVVSNVQADVTAPTNGNVTVTADFTDNVGITNRLYSIGDEPWQDYTAGGVLMTGNGTVYFKAVDTSGNESDIVTYTVTNIDKVAPTITGITPSTTAPAASVTVTATFSDDVALATQQYKIGAGAWQNYTAGVLVTENALVTFKAVDTAGNETTETYNVTNITSGGGTVVTGDVTDETKDINTGMVASDVNVNANGILNVYTGGLTSKTTVNTEGAVVVSGGSAVQTTVNAGGDLFLYAGGKADSTTDSGGMIHVYDGASATNTTLTGNGAIDICAGGAASSTTAENNGWIRVSAGGVTSDTTVKSGGKITLNGGGKITGKMTFETGAVVSAFENSIVDFNIYSLSPANEALVNNLSLISGTPKYTLTINGAQMLGTYNLANGAAGFDQTITVQSILGAEVGTLTVAGGATKIGDVYYTLDLTGSSLTVTVSSGGEADTMPPVVSNVAASITTPTNGDVTVTASFSDNVAVASSLYRINSGDWQNYTGGVTLTENATVYFKAVDTSGNESEIVSITVNNIDKTPPAKPVASANVTAPTKGSVNVSATFAEDSVQNEYSMDNVNWAPYPGMVKFDDNGTVYFRAIDEVGNISEVESYAVTNIDKIPPAKPTASADITTVTSGNVTVTAVFSEDSVKKEFSLDGLVWQDYSTPLVFSANGKAYFRGTDAAGNESGIISYEVTNIQSATPDNAPDDSRNDWVYNKKTKEWNSDENIASFVVNNVTAGDSEVRLDKVGSVEKDGKHNYLGRSGSDEDPADYAKIELSKGAALSFSIDSTVAGTFVVLQATKDKKGNPVTTQRQKITVKATKTSPSKQTTIYLEAGEYFVGMETKLPKKGDSEGYYNVNLAGTSFFDDADNGWNNSAYKVGGDGKEIKTELNPSLVSNAMLFGRGATSIQLDTGAMGKEGYANWVGFSDATDYRMLTLENAVNLTLSLTATGKAKLAIWKVSTNAKTGVISLTSKGSVSVKADKTGTIKAKFLEAGTYFVSITSTDASKGGGAYCNVSVDSITVFFDSADNGKNNELYNKKAKAFYPEDENHHFETTNISGAGTNVQLDSDPAKADGYKNFVGYQDKTDYAKINLTTDGNLFFKLKATGNATFTVYRKGQDKKGNDTLETIQTTKLKLAKNATVIDKFTDVISGLAAGEYYISMTATNTSTNAKGSVFYNVTATLEPADAASLAMPETSDSLGMTDSLSFGQYDADVFAGAYLDSTADKHFGESGNGLLASL